MLKEHKNRGGRDLPFKQPTSNQTIEGRHGWCASIHVYRTGATGTEKNLVDINYWNNIIIIINCVKITKPITVYFQYKNIKYNVLG